MLVQTHTATISVLREKKREVLIFISVIPLFCTNYTIVITINATDFIITLYRCAATCFSHFVVYIRPLGYVKTKITFRTSVTDGQAEI
jgi:uncharacterized radical SAM superfamily protein